MIHNQQGKCSFQQLYQRPPAYEEEKIQTSLEIISEKARPHHMGKKPHCLVTVFFINNIFHG